MISVDIDTCGIASWEKVGKQAGEHCVVQMTRDILSRIFWPSLRLLMGS